VPAENPKLRKPNPLTYRKKHDSRYATESTFAFLHEQLGKAGFAHIELGMNGEYRWMRYISPASTAILVANYTDKTRTVETPLGSYFLSPYEIALEIERL